jgi:hypothetical protein
VIEALPGSPHREGLQFPLEPQPVLDEGRVADASIGLLPRKLMPASANPGSDRKSRSQALSIFPETL